MLYSILKYYRSCIMLDMIRFAASNSCFALLSSRFCGLIRQESVPVLTTNVARFLVLPLLSADASIYCYPNLFFPVEVD